MRKGSEASYSSYDFEEEDQRGEKPAHARRKRSPLVRRIIGGACLAIGGIVVMNAVALQETRHPAPLFGKTAVVSVQEPAANEAPATPKTATATAAAAAATVGVVAVAARATDSTTTQTFKSSGADSIEREIARAGDDRKHARLVVPAPQTKSSAAPAREQAKSAAKAAIAKGALKKDASTKNLAAKKPVADKSKAASVAPKGAGKPVAQSKAAPQKSLASQAASKKAEPAKKIEAKKAQPKPAGERVEAESKTLVAAHSPSRATDAIDRLIKALR